MFKNLLAKALVLLREFAVADKTVLAAAFAQGVVLLVTTLGMHLSSGTLAIINAMFIAVIGAFAHSTIKAHIAAIRAGK